MGPAELSASLSSIKAAYDLTKAMVDLRDAAAVQTRVIELQRAILDAQQSSLALVAKVGELEEQVARLKAWDAEKQRYEIADSGAGTFAYRLKPESKGSSPDHLLCANCYHKHEMSILQALNDLGVGRRRLRECHRCKSTVAF